MVVAATLLCVVHAVRTRGRRGGWMMLALLVLGFVRENLVVLRAVLYEFAPLSLVIGDAPVIASTIWAFSIYCAIVWAETITGETFLDRFRHRRRLSMRRVGGRSRSSQSSIVEELRARLPSLRFLAAITVFMIALVGFYEPLLSRVDMARWESGTLIWHGVPAIAMIGYPSLALMFVIVWSATRGWKRSFIRRRPSVLAVLIPLMAWLHVLGLDRLKALLDW